MSRVKTNFSAICLLATLPACSLLVDMNPDGVIDPAGAAGKSGSGPKQGAAGSIGAKSSQASFAAGGATFGATVGGSASVVGSTAGGAGMMGAGGAIVAAAGTTVSPGSTETPTGGSAVIVTGIAGAANGGVASGGASESPATSVTPGGAANGGTATGGAATGGAATGGVATGGVATGGVATGGTTTSSSPCATQLCKNGGTCTTSDNSYTCKCVGVYFGSQCENAHFEWLTGGCDARGVSADGKVVVGSVPSGDTCIPARWTKETGFVALQSLTGKVWSGGAQSASADGSVVAGSAIMTSGSGAFRWNAVEGLVFLGVGAGSYANGVSSSGDVIVGTMKGTESTPLTHVFRWTAATGAQDIMTLAMQASVAGVSADGTTIAGTGDASAGYAYRWTTTGGQVRLESGGAYDISLDGSTVVGFASSGAYRWSTSEGGAPLSLGSLTGTCALVVNGNGNVVAGYSDQGIWIWDSATGVRLLDAVLTALGANLSNSTLINPLGMSFDGKALVGIGSNNGAATPWIARL